MARFNTILHEFEIVSLQSVTRTLLHTFAQDFLHAESNVGTLGTAKQSSIPSTQKSWVKGCWKWKDWPIKHDDFLFKNNKSKIGFVCYATWPFLSIITKNANMFWFVLGHNLKFRNSCDSSSCGLKEKKNKKAKLTVQSLQVASLQEADWILHSASSLVHRILMHEDPNTCSNTHRKSLMEKQDSWSHWRPPRALGNSCFGGDETAVKVSMEKIKKDVKFRTLPFTMNWLLQISIHPFFTVSSIISSYFPGGGWGLVWRLFLVLTYSSTVWT